MRVKGGSDSSMFPDPRTADNTGLVAMTSHLDAYMLLDAYRHGLFPWSSNPVRWYSPDPRTIFLPDEIHLPRNLPKLARKARFRVTYDRAFDAVIRGCADAHAPEGTWITPEFMNAYCELHEMGYAHSVEVWQNGNLAGGLYGVQLAGLFAGESMFFRVSNASKVAFAKLLEQLARVRTVLFDAQVINAHTARLGAVLIRREDYLYLLRRAMSARVRYEGQKWPAEPPNQPS